MRLLSDTFPPNRRAEEATEEEQVAKIREEDAEFYAAIEGDGDQIEECIDSMLARDGWLDKQPEEAVRAAIAKVLRKGEERGDWDGREAVTKFSDLFGILADNQKEVDEMAAEYLCPNAPWFFTPGGDSQLEEVIRCRECRHLGRETIVAGEYRCNRTERVTTLDDYCSRAVRRDV